MSTEIKEVTISAWKRAATENKLTLTYCDTYIVPLSTPDGMESLGAHINAILNKGDVVLIEKTS